MHVTSCPTARSHAAGETSPNGCRPSSYVEIRTIFTMPQVYRRMSSCHELPVWWTGICETHCSDVSRPIAADAGYTCDNDGGNQGTSADLCAGSGRALRNSRYFPVLFRR